MTVHPGVKMEYKCKHLQEYENLILSEYEGKIFSDFNNFNCHQELTSTGPGWWGIIDHLVEDLFKLGWNGRLAQVKEKFGTLRFYIGTGSDEIFERIHEAEVESSKTCEMCGDLGSTDSNTHGWIKTLCPDCSDKNRTWRSFYDEERCGWCPTCKQLEKLDELTCLSEDLGDYT